MSPAPGRPLRYAAVVAGAYLVAGAAWILFSDRVAAGLASSERDLAVIQEVKGLAFIATSGLLLFLFSAWLFGRLERVHAQGLEARDALVGSERRALAGVLASAVTHDINNMLTAIVGLNELLLADPRLGEKARARAEEMRRAIERMTTLVSRMRDAGGQATARNVGLIEVDRLARDVTELLRSHPRVRRCHVDVRVEAPFTVLGDVSHLHTALANLVLNAADASGGTGKVQVRVGRADDGLGLVEVHDDGPGIPPEVRPRVFEPFFTTKREGTGLGLLSVQAAAQLHGGRVEIDDSPLGGACVRLLLEAAPPRAQMSGPASTRAP